MRRAFAPEGALVVFAPAKVNLTLRVFGRRPDGYHELDSLVAFADVGDWLALLAGEPLAVHVSGPTAGSAGLPDDNLVLKAARALSERVPGLEVGRFDLSKRLPVAAGLGGGSADAGAALRLLAAINGLAFNDPRVLEAAVATGADVPVCVDVRARMMRGVGEILSEPLDLSPLHGVLVNPRVAVPTRDVFTALRARPLSASFVPRPPPSGDLLDFVADEPNDLERPAIEVQPIIADVLAALRALSGCQLARMSGSGATCFALFPSRDAARSAVRKLRAARPRWWIRATTLR